MGEKDEKRRGPAGPYRPPELPAQDFVDRVREEREGHFRQLTREEYNDLRRRFGYEEV